MTKNEMFEKLYKLNVTSNVQFTRVVSGFIPYALPRQIDELSEDYRDYLKREGYIY